MKKIYLFDWGDTLMVDFPGVSGKMYRWDHVETAPFAEEVLKRLAETALIYIATGAEDSNVEEIYKAFERVGLHRYITGIFCRQNTGFSKPETDFYLTILKHFSVSPDCITMVGDSLEKDILPCIKLGFNTIWLSREKSERAPAGVRVIPDLSHM